MVDEEKLVENKQQKSKIIAKKDLYMMGRKGGFRVEVREKSDGNRFLRVSRWSEKSNQNLYIVQEKHWRSLRHLIDEEYEKLLGWSGNKIKPVDSGGFISVEEHLKAIKKKDKEIKEKIRNINDIKKNLLEAQKAQIKTKLPQFKKSLAEFKLLLETNQKERVLHKFLKENFWIFGPQYISVIYEPKIGFTGRSDFLLERIDNYYDIVELKTSKESVREIK